MSALPNDSSFPIAPTASTLESIFAVRGDLDGEKETEFIEREQFIGLHIGDEEFLLGIAAVREIIMLPPITFVPNCPPLVDGVINLRGTILPALNMRKLMGLPRGEITPSSRIIIVRPQETSFGLIVDGITHVSALLPSDIERQSLPGKGPSGVEIINSVAKRGTRILGILDLTHVVRAIRGSDTESDDDRHENAAA